jgi:hypothetical protein
MIKDSTSIRHDTVPFLSGNRSRAITVVLPLCHVTENQDFSDLARPAAAASHSHLSVFAVQSHVDQGLEAGGEVIN